jgi:predicted DNA repair protein MutK
LATGLVALLDDVAGIAKLAASSLDDVGAAAGKASSKAAGVVIDDAAVTPRYVVGLTPDRELPIIAKIAKGSLRNKLIFLLPIALLLSALAPWALTPCLMVGGAYLCFEGAEKIFEAIWEHHDQEAEAIATLSSAELEQEKVSGAIRTDFILSGEIMAISLASVADKPLLEQAIVLAVVAVLITAGVYGVVGLIVKMDDIGLRIARGSSPLARAVGGGLVHTMPVLMRALSIIGTAAMLWVGGGILVHGLEEFGLKGLPHFIHHLAEGVGGGPVVAWAVNAVGAGIVGLAVGGVITAVVLSIGRLRSRRRA